MAKTRIAVLVGSYRKGSINQKLAKALAKLGEDRFDFIFCRIDDLPLFCVDIEDPMPAAAVRLKKEIDGAAGVLIVTPEHNRSIPAALKNAIDWANRPESANSWAGKAVAIAGASNGNIGTAVAQQNLRMILTGAGAQTMGQPTIYLAFKEGLIEEDGTVTVESTQQFFTRFMDRFADWVRRMG